MPGGAVRTIVVCLAAALVGCAAVSGLGSIEVCQVDCPEDGGAQEDAAGDGGGSSGGSSGTTRDANADRAEQTFDGGTQQRDDAGNGTGSSGSSGRGGGN